ncbi:hypothetical protein PUNSTDRAFT_70364 [Punctularia strigosozonata HHB-11173 SS5]|uniref:uncharacterized protein n=1 Tax=Punctularia strigosozonata (strain HHB-11173) TaxID=741275 RepID=UPI0004416B24|nr:uncharacterized protein PUNSTDRAFT_70364 [Punctularia strigosozonata HHB-11173 SS5]EIN07719.1 hypothetical protein PUNSTDRAFT_70364 [Punctularia strigosozonata HHB-11173 SS5]
MSSRLASFRGPSTPNSSPVSKPKQPNSPSSTSRGPIESPYHRKLRSALQDLRGCTRTWDDLVLHDGLKAAKNLVDARTELDNTLAFVPSGSQPQYRVVGPKLETMEESIIQLDTVIAKMRKQFQKMVAIVDSLEGTLLEAHKTKGWNWCSSDPLWVTWPFEKFVTSLSHLPKHYHRSFEMHVELVNSLRSHSTPFDVSREVIARWVAQPYLEEHSWDAEWEDLCEAEIDRWT